MDPEDERVFGVTFSFIGDEEEEEEPGPFEVFPENAEALRVFLGLATQWRIMFPPMGGGLLYQGIDYQQAETVMRMMAVEDQPDCFQRLRIMEAAALPLLNRD